MLSLSPTQRLTQPEPRRKAWSNAGLVINWDSDTYGRHDASLSLSAIVLRVALPVASRQWE